MDNGNVQSTKPVPVSRNKVSIEKSCRMCKKDFLTTREWQVFCVEACRVKFHKMINELGQCPNCGMELIREPA